MNVMIDISQIEEVGPLRAYKEGKKFFKGVGKFEELGLGNFLKLGEAIGKFGEPR